MSSSGSTPSFTPSRVPSPPPDTDSPAYAPSPLRASTLATTEDDEELARFRRQWREEVLRRTAAGEAEQHDGSAQAGPSMSREKGKDANQRSNGHARADESDEEPDDDEEARPHSPSRTRHLLALAEEQEKAEREEAAANASAQPRARPRLPPRQMVGQDAPAHGSAGTVSKMKAAVKAYATAVEMERKGDLDEALYHYRKAFRLDPAADRLYERAFALLRHTDANDDASASTEKQRDALLASAEVADMVRRATDFDDVRVAAIEKAKAEATKEQQEQEQAKKAKGPKAALKEPPASPPRRSAAAQGVAAAASAATHDELAEIIERAAASNEVEGRDLSTINFTSLPPSVSFKPGGAGQKRQGDLAEQMQGVSLEDGEEKAAAQGKDEEELPPPLIAKLPDEILAHICRAVVEPRGRRGARIKPPKVEAPATTTAAKGPAHKTNATPSAAGIAEKTPATPSAPAESAESSKPPSSSSPSQPIGVGIVLAGPDWQSLEMLARVSWKWRLTTRSRPLWSYIISETYQEPQLALPTPPSLIPNPRELFIHHPRLRLTGCYIAACHYSRQGLSVDNAWVRVVHLVEFYRSIRFLPDGRALTLLTTDVPRETVGRMHAGNGEQGFAVGRWRVEMPGHDGEGDDDDRDDDAYSDAHGIEEGRHRRRPHHHHQQRGDARVIIEDLRDRTRHKYSFQMILSLRSTSRGKWNKMEMLDYKSVNLETGEVNSIPNKHSRPFHFSAVRSFGV